MVPTRSSIYVRLVALAAACVGMLAGTADAWAGTIYSDLGPGGSFQQPPSAYVVNSSSPGRTPAFSFTASQTGNLAQIDVGVTGPAVSSVPMTGIVTLFDAAGNVPGVSLGTWNVTTFPASGQSALETISGITGVSLIAGDSYFLQLGSSAGFAYGWDYNNQGATGILDQNGTYRSSNDILAAFDLLSSPTPVPEPASIALLGAALLALLAALRTRSSAS